MDRGPIGENSLTFLFTDHAIIYFETRQLCVLDMAGGIIPMYFTCDGPGVSPEVWWFNAPEGTKVRSHAEERFAVILTGRLHSTTPWS
jgi:hypothetical protein